MLKMTALLFSLLIVTIVSGCDKQVNFGQKRPNQGCRPNLHRDSDDDDGGYRLRFGHDGKPSYGRKGWGIGSDGKGRYHY